MSGKDSDVEKDSVHSGEDSESGSKSSQSPNAESEKSTSEFEVDELPNAATEMADVELGEKKIDQYYRKNVTIWETLMKNHKKAPIEDLWYAVNDSPLRENKRFEPELMEFFKSAPLLPSGRKKFSDDILTGLDTEDRRAQLLQILKEMVKRKPGTAEEEYRDPVTKEKLTRRITYLNGPLREANEKLAAVLHGWERTLRIARLQLRKTNPAATINDAFQNIMDKTSKKADDEITTVLSKRDADNDTDPTNRRRVEVQKMAKKKGISLNIYYGTPSSVMNGLQRGTIDLLVNHLSYPTTTFSFRCPNYQDSQWMLFVSGSEVVGFIAIKRAPETDQTGLVVGPVPLWNSTEDVQHAAIPSGELATIRSLLVTPTPESVKKVVEKAEIPAYRNDDTVFDADEIDITFASWRTGFEWILPSFCFINAYKGNARNEYRFPVDLRINDDVSIQGVSQFCYQMALLTICESAGDNLSKLDSDIYVIQKTALAELKTVEDFSEVTEWHFPNPRGADASCNPKITPFLLMDGQSEKTFLQYFDQVKAQTDKLLPLSVKGQEHLTFLEHAAELALSNNRMLKPEERSIFRKSPKFLKKLSTFLVLADQLEEEGLSQTLVNPALWMIGTSLLSFALDSDTNKPSRPVTVTASKSFIDRFSASLPVLAKVFSTIHRCPGSMFVPSWETETRNLHIEGFSKNANALPAVAPATKEPKALISKINKSISASLAKIWIQEEVPGSIIPSGTAWITVDSRNNITIPPPEPKLSDQKPNKKEKVPKPPRSVERADDIPVINPTVGIQPEIIEVRAPEPSTVQPPPVLPQSPKKPQIEFVPQTPAPIKTAKRRIVPTAVPVLKDLDKDAIQIAKTVLTVDAMDGEALPTEMAYAKSTIDKAISEKRLTKRYRFVNNMGDVVAYLILVSTTYDAFAQQLIENPGEGFQFCLVPTSKEKMESSKLYSPSKGPTLDDPNPQTLKAAFKNVIASPYTKQDFFQVLIHAANFKVYPLIAEFAAATLPVDTIAVAPLPVVQNHLLTYPWDVELMLKAGWTLPYLIAYRTSSFSTNGGTVLRSGNGISSCAVKVTNRDLAPLTAMAQLFKDEEFEVTPGPFAILPQTSDEPNNTNQMEAAPIQEPIEAIPKQDSPEKPIDSPDKEPIPPKEAPMASQKPKRIVLMEESESSEQSQSPKQKPVPVTPKSLGEKGPSPASAQSIVSQQKGSKSPKSSSSSGYIIPEEPSGQPTRRRGIPADADALDNLLSDFKNGKFVQPTANPPNNAVAAQTKVPVPNTKAPAPMIVTINANTPAGLVSSGILTTNVPHPKRGRPSKSEKVMRILLGLQTTGVIRVDLNNL